MLMIPLLVMLGICVALAVSGVVTTLCRRKWQFFLLFSGVTFFVGTGFVWVWYRNSAKEAFSELSPDKSHRVVVYRLPNFSMTPGGGSDAPAIVRLYDSRGHLLKQADLGMIQMAQVEWEPGGVSVGGIRWQWPGDP